MTGPVAIPPDVRARLRTLRLDGRRVHGGDGFGLHRSRSRGAGLEFAQYRAYEPGDEPRMVDWKLYARSDRFFVRESERDSPLTAWVLVDATASMGQADDTRPDWSRLDAARALAACVLELALRQGDRFGVAAIAGDGLVLVPAGASAHAPRASRVIGISKRNIGTSSTRLWERRKPRRHQGSSNGWIRSRFASRFACRPASVSHSTTYNPSSRFCSAEW